MTVERIRGKRARAELVDYMAAREPETTWALAIMRRPDSERQRKVWVVRRAGSIAGVLVTTRYCFGRWTGILLLHDQQCAGEMASALDRSNLWTVAGPADGMEAVLTRTKRRRGLGRLWLYSVPYAANDTAPARGSALGARDSANEIIVRDATENDVSALVGLYSLDNLLEVPPRRLRGVVRRGLAYTLVAESPQGVVGAIMSSAAREYTMVNRLVVGPADRRGRLALTIVLSAGLAARADGKGICGFRPGPNGWPLMIARGTGQSVDEVRASAQATVWAVGALRPPTRFRGHQRLRGLIERLERGIF